MFVRACRRPASGLAERFGLILFGLRDLALRAARDRALAAPALVLWNRLSRMAARFAAIADRFRAGRLRASPAPRRRSAGLSPPSDPLPRQRGWLLRRLPECAAHGEYLRILIAEPDMAKLLEAAPQARRLLRPLWRML